MPHRHHDLFVRLFRTLEVLQRTLLGRQRPVGILALQLGLGLQHGFGGLRQQLGDGPEFRIGRHDAAVHATQQRLDLLAQAALGEGQEDEVLAVLLVAVVLPVADDVERAGDDLALRLGQRPLGSASAPPPAPPMAPPCDVAARKSLLNARIWTKYRSLLTSRFAWARLRSVARA